MRSPPPPSAMTSLLLLLAALASLITVSADTPAHPDILSAVRASMHASQVDVGDGDGSMVSLGQCLYEQQSIECLERRVNKMKDSAEGEQKLQQARAAGTDTEISSRMKEAVDLFASMLPHSPADPVDVGVREDGRGHKLKKKIHKIIKIIKIILFIIIMKLKMVFLMFMGQTLFQFKLVLITMMMLLIKKYYLYVEWKAKKEAAKQVVYYEHAQHQHHYDETDHFHDGLGGLLGGAAHGHFNKEPAVHEEPSHGWGGLWSKRSYGDPVNAHNLAYNAQIPAGAPPLSPIVPGDQAAVNPPPLAPPFSG